ncbi:ATP synthase F1 subunit delta [Spiroplasma endosymbiont of Crioceris asparagi]|uniref:ATP synthase F1 subunit delta n=1 Tax=Spiroplasma endosymbiont of Crioceris asparagi TaxID=3066286 RepID=UPI0030D03ED1
MALENAWVNAILEIAREKNKEALFLEQINALLHAFKKNYSITKMLSYQKMSKADIDGFIEKTFVKSHVDVDLINTIRFMIDSDVFYKSFDIFTIAKKQLITSQNKHFGKIISATTLSDAAIKKIANSICKKMNIQIEFINEVDETLLAGVKVVVGDKIFDSSLKGRFEDMRNQISKSNLE